MKTYLKRVPATMLCMLVVFCLSAQQRVSAQSQRQRMNAQDRAQRETEMMKTELNPTKEQLHLIDSVNLFYAKKMDEVMANGDREKMREAFEANAVEKDKAFKTILTDEQYKKWQEMEQRQREQRPGAGPGQGRPMRQNPNR